jgi:hypothetical protein
MSASRIFLPRVVPAVTFALAVASSVAWPVCAPSAQQLSTPAAVRNLTVDSAKAPGCGPVPIAPPSGLCNAPVTFGSAIPVEMAWDPAFVGVDFAKRVVDCFAWQSFAALNWPSDGQCRGAPASGRGAAKDWTSDRVWETYKEPYELFQATDKSWNPADISFNDPAPEGACGELPGKKILRRSAKFPLVSEDSQAFLPGAALTDQYGNAVWYEILMNREVFDYIRDSGLARTGAYSFGGPISGLADVDFPVPTNRASGAGTIEIKAAWREMTDDDDLSRYFTQDAVVYDGTDCTDTVVGLVGLHISRKVASSPKWIWATFEHVDNVPDAGSTGDGRDYSFFSLRCAINEPADCNQQVAIVDTDFVCCANLITYPSPNPLLSINQVTRLTPIQASDSINRRYRKAYAAAGSPFRYFMLVGAQFALPKYHGIDGSDQPFPPPTGRGGLKQPWQRPCNPNGPWAVHPPDPQEACYQQIPPALRNSSMETLFVQTDKTGTQFNADSCMNCHFAGGIDGSYLWLDAMLNPYAISGD